MSQTISPIIQAAELKHLLQTESIVFIDASNGPKAKANFLEGHLAGARLVDLDTHLAEIPADAALGGRHPLPKIAAFGRLLGELGITPDSHVVVYDDKNGSNAAARFWWMLRAVGHQKVQVLNGGMKEALKHQLPISSGETEIVKTTAYPTTNWLLPLIEIEELAHVSENDSYVVIDVRDAARYRGEIEPIDLVAGHIPGAINVPFTENLDAEGLFLSAEILRSKYQIILGDKKAENSVVHCGSGVTACHTLLAIAHAQLPLPRLYVGSWSEWSRNKL
jgi:thiosulfate/3-mercaptopyruvate sulfurtransferase